MADKTPKSGSDRRGSRVATHPHAASRNHTAKVQSQNKYSPTHTPRDPSRWMHSPQGAVLLKPGPQRSRALPPLPTMPSRARPDAVLRENSTWALRSAPLRIPGCVHPQDHHSVIWNLMLQMSLPGPAAS